MMSVKKKIKKNLSYSSPFSKNYYISVFTLNLLLINFFFSLLFSFCIGDNECQNNKCCCRSNCNGGFGDCNCSYEDNRNGLLACLIILLIIAIIYFSTKLCGRHSSRYISLLFIPYLLFIF